MLRILAVSLKYLGDVIVATPALRALHESFPHARLTVAVREGYEEALAGNPAVDQVLSVPMAKFRIGSIGSRLSAQWRTVRELRRGKYDLVVLFEPGDRETLFAWFSGARKRVGPDFQPLNFLLTDRVPIREGTVNFVDYYCAIAIAAGATVRSKLTEIVVSANDAAWARSLLGASRCVIGLHPGSREANKRWPPERWALLAETCIADGDTRAVLMSGRGEGELTAAIAAHIKPSPMLLIADDLSIGRTAALMQRCNICVTLDSASRHIAAAVGTRTVTLLPEQYRSAWDIYDPALHSVLIGRGEANGSLVASIQVEDVRRALAPH